MSNTGAFLKSTAFKKFRKNKLGVACLMYIFVMILVALLAYVIAPDKTKNANWGDLSIKSKQPGFEVLLLKIPIQNAPEFRFSEYFFGQKARFYKYPIQSYKISGDKIIYVPYSDDSDMQIEKEVILSDFPNEKNIRKIADKYISSQKFYLGTDKSGRDYLSRIIVGSRISLSIGFVAVFISLVVGLFFGSIGGYFEGKTDAFVMWLINIVWSIPTLLLVIAITLTLGKGFWQVFIAVGLTMWVEVARVVRGQIISVKQSQYITAAKALGYSHSRILIKHILPSVIAPIIVISAANFASAILVESGLSFLGLGAQPPTPSWGGMIKDSYSDIILGKPYLALIPGIAILLLTLSFMMVGNTLRDALDVKK
ncbi:MAG: ABC transporter permease [Flavobacteriaceae bacterium]